MGVKSTLARSSRLHSAEERLLQKELISYPLAI
jgi:hypothetical protein